MKTQRKKIKGPNILLVLADDVGTGDVPGYWNTGLVDMPNLQSIIENGVVFTDAHSTPLCSPSRYVMLSGNYQHKGFLYPGTWKVNYKSGQFLEGQQSIAEILRQNGFYTTVIGKWHLGGMIFFTFHFYSLESITYNCFHSSKNCFRQSPNKRIN
jgi:arylsulfatase A